MRSDNKYNGDDGSVGEELLAGISELEQKVLVIDKAVNEGYFDLNQALSFYKVSEKEYVAYLLLKNSKKVDNKQSQFFEALNIIVKIFREASLHFDPTGKKVMLELEAFAKEFH